MMQDNKALKLEFTPVAIKWPLTQFNLVQFLEYHPSPAWSLSPKCDKIKRIKADKSILLTKIATEAVNS